MVHLPLFHFNKFPGFLNGNHEFFVTVWFKQVIDRLKFKPLKCKFFISRCKDYFRIFLKISYKLGPDQVGHLYIEKDQINRGLMVELLQEAPGILRWAVDGAIQWAGQGLGLPEEISAATDQYHSQMDVLGRFLEEATTPGLPSNEIGARQLYRVYCQWAAASGEFTVSERVFGERLTDRGVTKRHTRSGAQYSGLRLSDAVSEFTSAPATSKSW